MSVSIKRSSILMVVIVLALLPLVSCEEDESSEESNSDVANVQNAQAPELTSTSTNSVEIPWEYVITTYRWIRSPLTIVMRSQAEYDTLPLNYDPSHLGPPNVDFDTEMLIGIFGGPSPPEGSRIINIRSVLLQDRIIRVTYWNKIAVGFIGLGWDYSGVMIKLARYDVPVQFIEDNNAP